VISGNHTIAAPLALASDTTITTGGASTLKVVSPLVAPGRSITKAGAGTVQLERVQADLLDITGGTVTLTAKGSANSAAGTSVLSTLFVSAGAAIDLKNNALVNNYTTVGTLPDTLRQMIQSGRITTSLNADGHALGYADNGTLGRTVFGGVNVQPNSVLIGYTYSGDANLDGKVNAIDFNALAANYGAASAKLWINGDFNYDGAVNSLDFTALGQNFNRSMPAPAPILGTLLPEPASALMAAVLIPLATRQRRRRHA
jgi:hypothetical protein